MLSTESRISRRKDELTLLGDGRHPSKMLGFESANKTLCLKKNNRLKKPLSVAYNKSAVILRLNVACQIRNIGT